MKIDAFRPPKCQMFRHDPIRPKCDPIRPPLDVDEIHRLTRFASPLPQQLLREVRVLFTSQNALLTPP
jgi:hypothetical protein